MAFVKKFNDFKLFQPTEEEAAAAQQNLAFRIESNRRTLMENSLQSSRNMKITGSFISAHAPDYIGVPTIRWTVDDWQKEFRTMKKHGIDTVILQAAAWKELEECYFLSEVLSSFEQFDVIAPLTEAAENENMILFLGGLGSVAGWNTQDAEKTRQEIKLHKAVLTELAERYGNRINGFYFPCETAFRGKRRIEHEKQYSNILGEFCRAARELLPGKPIIMSPASKYFENNEKDFIDCWKTLFVNGAPDILAPQDSIGCGCCNLRNQNAMWRLWKELANSVKCRLWANIELFERCSFGGEDPFDAASAERVERQIANVEDCVEKCICWEYSYFVNGNANGSTELKAELFD